MARGRCRRALRSHALALTTNYPDLPAARTRIYYPTFPLGVAQLGGSHAGSLRRLQ